MTKRTVLIIGATGVFGSRLARHLCADRRVRLVLTGRSESKLARLSEELRQRGADATHHAADVADAQSLDRLLRENLPWMTANASGPFTADGLFLPFRILQAGSHYVDIADDPSFLSGFAAAIGGEAQKKGLAAICGASTTPAISGTAVDAIAKGWRNVHDVEIAVCPAGRSEVGRAVIESVLSTVGRPVQAWSDGCPTEAIGWTDGRTIGIEGIGGRRIALASTIDPHRIGTRHGVTGHVRFCAGLESTIEQVGMEALATLVRTSPSIRPESLAPALHATRSLTKIPCGDDGAMRVAVSGTDEDGNPAAMAWTLVARHGSGPYVPVMAAAAIIRKAVLDEVPPGARMADEVLSLREIESELAPYPITTSVGSFA